MKESIKIEERLEIFVVDKKTGKLIRKKEIKPKRRPGWLLRIFPSLRGTVLTHGKNQAAKLFVAKGGYAINRIVSDPGGNPSTMTVTAEDLTGTTTGSVAVNNSLSPWTTQGTYSWLKTTNSSDPTHYHNSIPLAGFYLGADAQWWARISFVFSSEGD